MRAAAGRPPAVESETAGAVEAPATVSGWF
jgi:hypothetical protein